MESCWLWGEIPGQLILCVRQPERDNCYVGSERLRGRCDSKASLLRQVTTSVPRASSFVRGNLTSALVSKVPPD